MDVNIASGTIAALALAACTVGADMQQAVKARLGVVANTFVLSAWQGWMVISAWSVAVAIVFLVVIQHPKWASSTFQFDVPNNAIAAGVAVGISAVIVIRSKLAKIGNIEVGGEWAYLWSRAYVLNAVNQIRVRSRIQGERLYNPIALDVAQYPEFFSRLEDWLTRWGDGKDLLIKEEVEAQIIEIKKQVGSGAPDQDVNARKYLVGIMLDYTPPHEFNKFASDERLPLRL